MLGQVPGSKNLFFPSALGILLSEQLPFNHGSNLILSYWPSQVLSCHQISLVTWGSAEAILRKAFFLHPPLGISKSYKITRWVRFSKLVSRDSPGWPGNCTVWDGGRLIILGKEGMRVEVVRAAEPTSYQEKGFLSHVRRIKLWGTLAGSN